MKRGTTLDIRDEGWPSKNHLATEPCRSVLARLNAGLPRCEAVAVWKVERCSRVGGAWYVTIGYYCDVDLPAEDRSVVAR